MKSVAAAITLLVCVALVHSVPVSKGQTNTNINKNTNTNGNYESLYNFLFGLLDTSEEEELIETPLYKPPAVYKPTKPYPVYPGGGDGDYDEEDKYPVVTKPPTTNYGYAPYKPTISTHKPCRHCPAKPTPYKPYKIPSGSYGTVNKNTNVASNTNINDANLAAEEDDSDIDSKKVGVK